MKTVSSWFESPPIALEIEPAPLIVSLDGGEAVDASQVGGKGANLVRLLQAGLPVPPGFCITTEAFRLQIASRPDIQELCTALAELESGPTKRLLAAAARIRKRLAAAPLVPSIERAVVAVWEGQGATRAYAIRSSATIEDDSLASFAGQGETFLNVRGRRAILDGVRACWASLFADRAILYRKRQGIDGRTAAMAVVVQEMIRADVSGVLFAADPLTGDASKIVIESTYGLGQLLVSGKVSPDRITLARPGLETLSYRLGNKRFEVVAERSLGIRRKRVKPSRAKSPCLDGTTVRQLGKLALQAEQSLGGPQDIEWAVARRQIVLLQSRPITTAKPAPQEPPTIWCNMNSWEVLPGVVAPMSWSLADAHLKCMFRPVLEPLGIDIDKQPLFGLVAGRAYANLNTFAAIARAVPLPGTLDFADGLGGQEAKRAIQRLIAQAAERRSGRLRKAVGLLRIAIWVAVHVVDQRSKRHFNTYRRQMIQLASADLGGMSNAELVRQLGVLLSRHRQFGPDLAADVAVAIAFVRLFFAFMRSRLGPEGGAAANRLLEGLGGLASAEAGLELWELAEWARRQPELATAIAQAGDFAALRRCLADSDDGHVFLTRWEQFLVRHGHHACGEFDVSIPRWSEIPDDVLNLLRCYLNGLAATDPGEFRRRLARRRAELAAKCRGRLKHSFDAPLFDFLLRKAQFAVTIRENARNEVVRMLGTVRQILLELGRRLTQRGALADCGDIFYLELSELLRLVAGASLAGTIASRKAEHAYNQTITPPPIIEGRFEPGKLTPDAVPSTVRTLRGLPASAGVATGPARVMLHPEADQRILPGEILVASYTDPGWTPHFLAAAGIVMDVGGVLSHGSIVAREYGIPAVVNVGHATQAIRTGQVVQVDGDRGVVTVLS